MEVHVFLPVGAQLVAQELLQRMLNLGDREPPLARNLSTIAVAFSISFSTVS